MHRWTVGDVEVTRIEDLDFAVASEEPVPEWCVPDLAPSTREVGIAFSTLAIAADGLKIVVDPWMANDGPRDEADASEHSRRLLDQLASIGFAAAEVDVVVNTHLDGIGWNTRPTPDGWAPSFPRARYLYPLDEVEAIEAGEDIYGHEAFRVLDAAVSVERVEPPYAVSASVTLVDAPGHNFGHVAVRIESDDALAIYPGHLILSPFQIADPNDDRSDDPRLPGVAGTTRRSILGELADRHGLLLTTLLGGSGSGVVTRAGDDGFALG